MPIPKTSNAPAWYHEQSDDRDGLISQNILIDDTRTSIRLDAYTWEAIREIADREDMSPNDIYSEVASDLPKGLNFTVALRQYVLRYFRERAGKSRR